MIIRTLARGHKAAEFVLIVVIALALAVGIQAFIVKPYKIPSPSMEPTLTVGQRVLVDRIGNDFSAPGVGDIVVFHPPKGALGGGSGNGVCGVSEAADQPCSRPTRTAASENYIKRVVAVGGDTIAIRGGHVYRNGVRAREPFADFSGCEGGVPTCTFTKPIKVPAGYFFMMGDNRGESDDSRFWGPVPDSWIIGIAFASYWPLDRIGIL